MVTIELIKNYANYLDLTFSDEDCREVLEYANAIRATDYKDALWCYLDEFEGISHDRDSQYWEGDK